MRLTFDIYADFYGFYPFLIWRLCKKPLGQRWHEWGHTGIEVQRDIMSAFLACYG